MLTKSIPTLNQCCLARQSEHCYDSPVQMLMLVEFSRVWSFRFGRVRVSWLVPEPPRFFTSLSPQRETGASDDLVASNEEA